MSANTPNTETDTTPNPKQLLEQSHDDELYIWTDSIELTVLKSRSATAKLTHLYIDPEYRGQNLGTKVLDAVIEELREDEIASLTATIGPTELGEDGVPDPESDPTAVFLREYGFRYVELVSHYSTASGWAFEGVYEIRGEV